MSLFPAFSDANEANASNKDSQSDGWLENSSFTVGVINSQTTKDQSEEGIEEDSKSVGLISKGNKLKKHKKHGKKPKKQIKDDSDKDKFDRSESFYKIDTTGNLEFLSEKTIASPWAPKYKVAFKLFNPVKSKKCKLKRYFHFVIKNESGDEGKLTKQDLAKEIVIEKDTDLSGHKQEESLVETTAYYNKCLNEDPHNVDLWLKYVHHQDAVFQFEKSFRKGSIAKGLHVTADRKLSILEKALSHNPNSELLMRERLAIAISTYPADELQIQLKKLVEKDSGNIIWWQGYIEASQCSMSHCNIPAVLKLYTSCLSILHQLRRNSVLEKSHLEENILRILYQCGLFMKQSGLFEQLWTLLRLYLELNLSPSDKNKFNIISTFEDKQLVELEEVVLQSQLPIHELWLRIEKLRESCHWLPFVEGDNCEDPQRIVFPEDVAELIHPITMPGNTFKLTAMILTLLKTPLLPCRHTTMQSLGLDYVPWAVDCVETLLPVFFPLHSFMLSNKYLLKDTQRLAIGPQYLKTFPGQQEYLEFVLTTMKNCIDCLHGKEKAAVSIWWFRFQRLLIVLDKEERFKMPPSFKKKMKNSMKQLLKSENNRNNVIFYQEYALIEYELGNVDSAINVINTALQIYDDDDDRDITNIPEEERSGICLLYRTLVELHLNLPVDIEMNKQKALKYLVHLTSGRHIKNTGELLTENSLEEVALKFKHVTLQCLQKGTSSLMSEDHFLPDFYTDWIICNGWFLYLTKGTIQCGVFLEEIINSLENQIWQKEVLFEFYIMVLFKNCLENRGVGLFKLLDDALYRAIRCFPNNLFLLSVLAKEQSIRCCLGQPFWKQTNLLMKTGHAIPSLFLILIANQRSNIIEENCFDTITGKKLSEDQGLINLVVSLFKRITSTAVCTRRCGLVWRLYLQFLHDHFGSSLCRKAYYRAVEECPWFKPLYIDAAIYIPAELAQIQDLLIEKQLRLHVTPEELDVLRT